MQKKPDLAHSDNVLVELEKVQRKNGCITEEEIVGISKKYDVPVSMVYGVATFYSFLNPIVSNKPKAAGRNIIRICRSLPCHLKEMEIVQQELSRILGIKPGETTADRKFSLELTNCIGACDMAPAMLVNDDLHGNLTIDNLPRILENYQ